MGLTSVEKIVSRASGKSVRAGEKLEALAVDRLYLNEVVAPPAIINFSNDFGDVFRDLNRGKQVFDRSRVTFFADHSVPSCSESVSRGIAMMKSFSNETGVRMYREGDGIEHTVAGEEGSVLPGEIVVATDSHTCTQGALGALAFGIGATEAEYALANGEIYSFSVPETIRFLIDGKLCDGVYAKDLILHILGMMGQDGCSGRIAEFAGGCVGSMNMDGRFTMCNLSVEMGARSAIVNPDDTTYAYIREAFTNSGKIFDATAMEKARRSDMDAEFSSVIQVDASGVEPTVALPHSPANARPVGEVDEEIDTVFIGSCANARKSDLEVAARILEGKKVSSRVNLIVIPASRRIYNWAASNGILSRLAEAGANIESSNCGPCFGKHMGVLGPGERCLSTSNRNYRGRMGSGDALIYLASPAVAAATAIEGRIADPRKYLR
jgi:3-isopropylmalate/(R)-2-methylmalate dehydratase large subunit